MNRVATEPPADELPSAPRIMLRLEGLAVLALAAVLYSRTSHGWAWFFVLLLAPDFSMLGYLVGHRAGAACYNAVHSYTVPLLLVAVMLAAGQPKYLWAVWVWMAHIGLDRLVGYGLKYTANPRHTHLQQV